MKGEFKPIKTKVRKFKNIISLDNYLEKQRRGLIVRLNNTLNSASLRRSGRQWEEITSVMRRYENNLIEVSKGVEIENHPNLDEEDKTKGKE